MGIDQNEARDSRSAPSHAPETSVGAAGRGAPGRARGAPRRWLLARVRWSRRRMVVGVAALVVALWLLLPAARVVALLGNGGARAVPVSAAAGLPIQAVSFAASDGTRLSGWFVLTSPTRPTIILVPGFKASRVSMLPWAHFLFAARYNVLLFDDRGCGASAGWHITLAVREPDDVIGAVAYVRSRKDLVDQHVGALGVSEGAGTVLLAAAREPGLGAVVADSAWTDEQGQLDRLGTQHLGPLTVPLPPYGPALADLLAGGRIENVRPLAVISQIAPRAVLLIASADDANTLTPPADSHELYAAAGDPKGLWIAPSGGHAGALAAHPSDYEQHVLSFFAAYLA